MSTAPASARSPSALDAAQRAVAHTRATLFPFRFERWVVFGLAAFLDQCGRRAGLGFNIPSPGRAGTDGRELPAALGWLAAHALLVALLAAAVLALVVVLAAVVLYVNSRGVFMYIDAVATGRAEIRRPWLEHADRASSYFGWAFGLTLVSLLGVVFALLAGAAVAVKALRPAGLSPLGVVALLALGAALLAFLLVASLASLLLRDFVAPLQLATGLSCGGALRLVTGLLAAHPGTFAVYVLLKVAFALMLGALMLVSACVTCCCALLPVVCQTLFQPAFFFERAWSLYLLRAMGFDVLGPFAVPTPAGPAGVV